MYKPPQRKLIPLIILCAIISGVLAYFLRVAGIVAAVCTLVVSLVSFILLSDWFKNLKKLQDRIIDQNSSAAGKIITQVNVPCMLYYASGRILWRNQAMEKLYDGIDIKTLPAACQPKQAAQTTTMEYNGGAYQVINMPVERGDGTRELLFQYWINRNEAWHYRRLYEEQTPRVALIYVDNYEELSADLQFYRNTLLTQVESLVADMTTRINGIYRRYDSGRFIVIFEAQYLERLESERFTLLEQAHKLDTGVDQTVTLSIAVGASSRIQQADSDARQAMELALGRGGDQAVVKNGANYKFFGGRKQRESGHSRVRTRLFAKALHQLMENAAELCIMGHKQPDMDCIGAALGVMRCATHIGCRAHIVLDQVNPTIQQAVDAMRANPVYAEAFVSPEAARGLLHQGSVLVVVDTQRSSSTIAPDLLERAGRIVLIDHHRRSADYIDTSTLNYLDARASSTSEMVTETIQYFDDKIRPTAFECSMLLAGVTVDTKHFAFNVGARTFEAAAYLRQHGADIGMVKRMFQDDRETYADRVDTVKNATIISPGVALAVCPSHAAQAPLITAQAADDLVGIRGIDAAFVLGMQNGEINVSGRSLGRINVQIALERIGGGGHLTMAGAQISNKTIDEAAEVVKTTILRYIKEMDKKD
ncbi:MAG: DHH family phosphoesterase [Clostridiales bacterium]|jgi:c-di-AMP phosphodiesterase-like protein|nr:DHH family phosphoesterase [Clostridiales bacterium]